MKTVFISPNSSGHNEYINLIKCGLSKNGVEVFNLSKRNLFRFPLRKDLAFMNWIDNELVDKDGFFSYSGFFLFF